MSYRALADKRHKVARDLAMSRHELGTDGGTHRETRPAAGLTSAPVRMVSVGDQKLIQEWLAARGRA